MSDETTTTEAPAPAAQRRFLFNGMELTDIDPGMSPEQIRDIYAATYGELNNAKVKGPDVTKDAGGAEVKTFTFVRNVGHLG